VLEFWPRLCLSPVTLLKEAEMSDSFSRDEALRFGWNTMKANLGFFIVLLLIMFMISAIPNAINSFLQTATKGSEGVSGISALTVMFTTILSIASQVISFIMQIGVLKISLKFYDGEKPDFSELFKHYRLFWRFLGASLLVGLIVLAGFILFIVPGIIWAIRYSFVNYLIVDKNFGIMESLHKSREMTDGKKGDLFVFFIVLLLINILGVICLGVGLFATIPTSMLAFAFVYRQLLVQVEPAAAGSSPMITPQVGE
jgi:uncharacterized membrane protein